MKKEAPVLKIIIPCYNEEKVLPLTSGMFLKQLEEMISEELISEKSRIVFVDDGSKDSTWDLISGLAKENPYFTGLRQSRNRGHQNAVLAGLLESRDSCDITISIDCDGQDDISAMSEMVKAYREGNEIVYGVRSSRETDTFLKRNTALLFYRLLEKLGVESVYNHADYRLVSSRVLNEFADFREVNLYLRGMFPLVGFSSTSVYYERHERLAGESHYPLKKMLNLAIDGITGLSIKPLELLFVFGCFGAFVFGLLLVLFGILTLIRHGANGTLMICLTVCFVSSIQLIALGIVGVYVGKSYMETKARPRYIISERTGEKEDA